jgi:Tfp pilus assembly protein PilV
MIVTRLEGRDTVESLTIGLGPTQPNAMDWTTERPRRRPIQLRKMIGAGRQGRASDDQGFSLIEVVMASVVLMIAVFSLTDVLINSMVQTAYARQKSQATNLANQTMEEVRALPWTTIELGMNPTGNSDPTFTTSADPNITPSGTGYCFEGSPIDVASVDAGSCSLTSTSWQDPPCLAQAATTPPPAAGAIVNSAPGNWPPISPHQACYLVGSFTYAVDVYITGSTGVSYAGGNTQPLTATVVVTWRHPYVQGVPDDVVTTTVLTPCVKGGDTSCGY